MKITQFSIIIDTREQAPWSFPEHLVKTQRGTLKTGDYALVNDDNFAIERKSLSDFLGTISSGWERFLREIDRMEDFPARVIIVEGNMKEICFYFNGTEIKHPEHRHHSLAPHFIFKRIAELTMKNVSVLFAESPDIACAMAYRVFEVRMYQLLTGRIIDEPNS